MSLGYFQRLAERSGLDGKTPSVSSQVPGPAAEQVPPEVHEQRNVGPPSNDHSPQQPQHRESNRAAAATRSTLTAAEPPPDKVDDNTFDDVGKREETSTPDPAPTEKTLSLRELAHREEPPEFSISPVEQPDANIPRFALRAASEWKEVESQAKEEMAPQPPAKNVSATGPAQTQPSFITQVERQWLRESRGNETSTGPDSAAETAQEGVNRETTGLQVEARPDPNRQSSAPEWSPPAAGRPQQGRQQQGDEDNSVQISIGQIQVEIHAPPAEAPVRPVPVAPPAVPARPRNISRPTNLRRFYLRGL